MENKNKILTILYVVLATILYGLRVSNAPALHISISVILFFTNLLVGQILELKESKKENKKNKILISYVAIILCVLIILYELSKFFY